LETVTIKVNEKNLEVQAGANLMEACLENGVYIPHLCYHPDLKPTGDCGLCMVEIAGQSDLQPACNRLVTAGMVVRSETERVKAAQRRAIEEILAIHPAECGSCVKYLNCELQSLKQYFGIDQLSIPRRPRLFAVNDKNPLLVIDPNKCVLCERCVRACRDLREVGILSKKTKDGQFYIGTENDRPLAESGCRFCGACAEVCPTGAILDKEENARGSKRKRALLPCKYQCPAEIDVPGYLRRIRSADFSAAEALVRERAPFPGVLGYVCDHPCEAGCRRGQVNQPISIRELKRFAVDHSHYEPPATIKPASGKRVGVIGSGPAGLTAAYYLARQGHQVTVYEKADQLGGMPRQAIPAFRLPEAVLAKEIDQIGKMGIEFKTNYSVENPASLLTDGCDAVLLATGTHKGARLPIPGSAARQVLVGLDFLKQVKRGEKVALGSQVVVLGGGSVAFDCARTALRLGALKVKLTCLESRETLPAAAEDIQQGLEEGVEIIAGRSFTQIKTEGEGVAGIQCLEVEALSFDENKVPQIETRSGSEQLIEADTIIMAVGQRADLTEACDLNQTANHLIEVDAYSMATSQEGIFAAGDVVNGPSSVVKAVASGRKAAMAIDRNLGGDGNIEEILVSHTDPPIRLGRDDKFASLTRNEIAHLAVEARANFETVNCPLENDAAAAESQRCLQCDLRLKIRPVKFWSGY
jgi:formate dehydrogenase (NADP+) beta subunit